MLGLLDEALTAIEKEDPTADEIHAIYPDFQIGTYMPPHSVSDWPRLVVIEETPEPSTEWGETAVKTHERVDDNMWRQVWTIEEIPLADAKAQLAEMAIDIYWEKMDARPTVAELTAAAGSYQTVKQGRETRFKPKLLDVRTRIQSAATVAAARGIWQELRDLP